jgi:hypothetical protein
MRFRRIERIAAERYLLDVTVTVPRSTDANEIESCAGSPALPGWL